MSEDRVCCNCRRNIRRKDKDGRIECHCEIDGSYIGYLQCHTGWCRRWATDKKEWEKKGKHGTVTN